jgi:ABC-2 type transport system ATP-binding protein
VTAAFDSYQVRALTDVSFSVRRGEVLGVLGGTGSGKSVALKLLAGRLRPTEGSVKVFGVSPTRARIRARVGFLPGRPAARSEDPWFGWRRFLGAFLPRAAGAERERAGAADSRRAQLRQAVLGNRDLVILDDAFSELDTAGREEVKQLVRALAARGKTIVIGTDSLADARDVCDRLCILHDGKVQAMGSLSELLAGVGSIRFLAPVLPDSVAQQLLSVMRREFPSRSADASGNSTSPGGANAAETSGPEPEAAAGDLNGVNPAKLVALTGENSPAASPANPGAAAAPPSSNPL